MKELKTMKQRIWTVNYSDLEAGEIRNLRESKTLLAETFAEACEKADRMRPKPGTVKCEITKLELSGEVDG
jgi:hypothetical protein